MDRTLTFLAPLLAAVAVLLAASCARPPMELAGPPSAAGISDLRRGVVSPPRPGQLFPAAERVVSYADRVEFAVRPVPGQPAEALLLAVPPGGLDPQWSRVELLSLRTGEVIALVDPAEIEAFFKPAGRNRAADIVDLGWFRRTRVAAVRYNSNERVGFRGESWHVVGLEGRIGFPAWRPRPVDDPAFADPDGPYQRYLAAAVANHEAALAYAAPGEPFDASLAEAPPWRPDPALSGTGWLRIEVREDDLYQINARWLSGAGWPAGMDPRDLVVVSRGEVVPTFITGPPDSTFAQGGRLFFYGLGSRAPETAARVYYLGTRTAADAPGPRWHPPGIEPGTVDPDNTVTSFNRILRLEEDNELMTRVGSFLSIRDMTWVWHPLADGEPLAVPFDADGLAGDEILVGELRLYLPGSTIPEGMVVSARINGQAVIDAEPLGPRTESLPFTVPAGTVESTRNTLEVEVSGGGAGGRPAVYLDWVELRYRSMFKANGGRLAVDFARDNVFGWRWAPLVGFRATQLLALDISDPEEPRTVAVEGSGRDAMALLDVSRDRRYLVLEFDRATAAPAPSPVRWADLWNPADSPGYLVITHEAFADEARRLAREIEARTPMSAGLVDIESVYDNYSWGETTPSAIRRYLARLLHAPGVRPPAYVLLVGDSTSDGRGTARNGIINYVPTYTVRDASAVNADQYAADAYFTWLGGEDELPDVFLGRLSVANRADAAEVVDKILDYRAQEAAPWADSLLTVTDPGEFENVQQAVHGRSLDPRVPEQVLALSRMPWEDNFYLPPELLDGAESKVSPAATTRIQQAIEEGVGLVVYYGHGSPNIWSNQRIWFAGDSPNSDNLRLDNRSRLPFMASLTCNNGAIDYPVPRWNICFAEDMMRVPNGGIVGCFVPSGPGYARNHGRLADGLLAAWSQLGIRESALLCELARLKYMGAVGPDDHSRMFLLLGDPSLALHPGPEPVELAFDPPRQPPPGEPFSLNVSVPLDHAPARAVARVADSHGQVLGESVLAFDADSGVARGTVTGVSPLDGRSLRLQAHAEGIADRRTSGGASWHPALPAVSLGQVRVTSASETTVQVDVHLANASAFPADLVVEAAAGADAATSNPLRLAPGQSGGVSLAFAPDTATGIVAVRVTLAGHDEQLLAERAAYALPRRGDGFLDVVPELIRIAQGRPQEGTSIVDVSIINAGNEGEAATLHWRIHQRRAVLQQSFRELGFVPPGSARQHSLTVGLPSEISVPHTFEVTVAPKNVEADWSRAHLVEFRPEDLGDLVIESITPPGSVTEGATVFVEAVVANRGGGMTQACSVILEDDADGPRREGLRNMAGTEYVPVPPLAPGETWPVRLRWDPRKNLGTTSVAVLVDPKNSAIESDKTNNRERVPLDIRSMWQLAPMGMAQGEFRPSTDPSSPGVLPLVARVGNWGQTDARRVSVTFYRTEEQREEDLLGEVIVERIPAGTSVDVVFDWDLAGEDPAAQVRPSFDLAIKGSLQRISSVTE